MGKKCSSHISRLDLYYECAVSDSLKIKSTEEIGKFITKEYDLGDSIADIWRICGNLLRLMKMPSFLLVIILRD